MTSEKQLRAQALEIHARLERTYGVPERPSDLDPIEVLVRTILSQNTNDILRDKAYDKLREVFSDWQSLRDADVDEIEGAIQVAGLGQQKARSIKQALQEITEQRGRLDLTFLRDMGLDDARNWLVSLHGVGPKTAAIVLLFALGMPAFPVDTHVFRVTKRLGLIPQRASREKAHTLLEMLMPPETYYSFHINLIRHGREICQARRPRCEVCPLQDVCDYYANVFTA